VELRTSELGFAAFMILRGGKLTGYSGREFTIAFNTKVSESEMRVEWINSDCAKFDKIVLDLKNFRK
jgi:hypothetical protein